MKRLVLFLGGMVVMAAFSTPAMAFDGYYYRWRENHFRHHDDLNHRAYHREVNHREAHRYGMSYWGHERLHDALDHEVYHDAIEHRSAHRSGAYAPHASSRYGFGYHGRGRGFRIGW